jgi:hypothetical protein
VGKILVQWQLKNEEAATVGLAFYDHLAAVRLDHTLHDGQPQPTAFNFAGLAPVEALKDMGQIVEADASAIVSYP